MGMSGGHGGDYNAEINVTPLVDVMLVLLVVFMITAPLLNTGVELDLPEVTAQSVEDPEGKLTLSIDDKSKLFLGKTPVKWGELQGKLTANERVQRERELYIEAHKDLPYSVVVTAMAVAREAGVTKLQMLTDPANQLDLATLDGTEKAESSGGSSNEKAPKGGK